MAHDVVFASSESSILLLKIYFEVNFKGFLIIFYGELSIEVKDMVTL